MAHQDAQGVRLGDYQLCSYVHCQLFRKSSLHCPEADDAKDCLEEVCWFHDDLLHDTVGGTQV